MNSNSIGKGIIKYLLVALGLAVFILGGLFLNHNFSQAEQLPINLQSAISIFMLCAGVGFCFIAFKWVK
jgi:uncharacterized membrane protein